VLYCVYRFSGHREEDEHLTDAQEQHAIFDHAAACYIISVVSVCQMITFECLDIVRSFSLIRYVSKGYGSSSYMKIIGQVQG